MRSLLLLGILALGAALHAAPIEFTSGQTRTQLLELFTSEGCSSCPPAESWLAQLQHAPGLWRDFVPVAWHVDYWDRLGWKDRFATPEATARQRAYVAAWRSRTVYTPCFVLDGREGSPRQLPTSTNEPAGILRARYDRGRLHTEFAAGASAASIDYVVHVAVLGTNLVSKVNAGENSGRTLRHGFVVRATAESPLRAGQADLTLALPSTESGVRLGLAVWVTRRDELTPLQATGGWLE